MRVPFCGVCRCGLSSGSLDAPSVMGHTLQNGTPAGGGGGGGGGGRDLLERGVEGGGPGEGGRGSRGEGSPPAAMKIKASPWGGGVRRRRSHPEFLWLLRIFWVTATPLRGRTPVHSVTQRQADCVTPKRAYVDLMNNDDAHQREDQIIGAPDEDGPELVHRMIDFRRNRRPVRAHEHPQSHKRKHPR